MQETAPSGRPRILRVPWRLPLALLAGLILLAAAVAPWTVSSERLAATLTERAAARSGIRIVPNGRASIALLPIPRIKLARASVEAPGGSILVKDAQIRAELAFLPLLAGRIVPVEATVVGGAVAADRLPDGRIPWMTALASVFAAEARTGDARLRRLVLLHTRIDLQDPVSGVADRLDDVSAVLGQAGGPGSVDVAGSARWRGEAVEFQASVGGNGTTSAAGGETVSVTAKSRHGRATATGTLGLGGTGLRFSGEVSAATPSIRDFAGWLGRTLPPDTDRSASIEGTVRADRARIDVVGLAIGLGRDRLDGALSAINDGQPDVRATLAGTSLDLEWLRLAIAPAIAAWSETGAQLGLPSPDLDLRLSAAELKLGSLTLRDAAASLIVEGDRVEATLLRAGLDGGVAKGRVQAVLGSDRRSLKLQGSIDGVEAAPFLTAFGLPPGLSGKTSAQTSVESSATAGASLLGALAGRAVVTLRRGALAGLDVPAALRRPDQPAAGRGGRTDFQTVQLAIRIADGVAEIADGTLDSSALKASLEGRISLPARFVSFRAVAAQPTGPGVTVDVNGPWSDPNVVSSPPPLGR